MLDLIFPNICPFCESPSEGREVCKRCKDDIVYINERSVCLRCGVPFRVAEPSNLYSFIGSSPGDSLADGRPHRVDAVVPRDSADGHFCGRCLRGEFNFLKARSVAYYDRLLRDMLHKFKYNGKLSLGRVLSRLMSENYPNDMEEVELIVTVPLHVSKLRKREFNQSVILASGLTGKLGLPLDPFVLVKLRETRPQFEISDEGERRKNVKGVFSLVNPAAIKGKSLLLVDDIFTTGSTVDECARVLLQGGASKVQVLTLLRASQR
jgi:ComF family protein